MSLDALLYYEDLRIGQQFRTDSHALDTAQIKAFASQFDPQPFHLDEDAARATLFEGLAASGWHTVGITMRLLVKSGPRIAGGLVGAAAEVSWPRPTRPDDVLHVVSEVIDMRELRSRTDRGMVTMRNETRNQHGDVLQVLTSKLVVPRRISTA